jgi:hypothetical protein
MRRKERSVNFPPPLQPEWATHVPFRRPELKLHKRKGDAVSAYRFHATRRQYNYNTKEYVVIRRPDVHLLFWNGGSWDEVEDV